MRAARCCASIRAPSRTRRRPPSGWKTSSGVTACSLGSQRPVEMGGRRHFHLDHLGSARLITADNGQRISSHDYYPFGDEYSPVSQETAAGFDREEPMKFTGHERDFAGGMGGEDGHAIDDMHARYYGPSWGRFLSVDPIGGNQDRPQSWNRYCYVANRPLGYVDPTGLADEPRLKAARDSDTTFDLDFLNDSRRLSRDFRAAARRLHEFYLAHEEGVNNTLLLGATIIQIAGESEAVPPDVTLEKLEEAVEDLGPINSNELNHVFGKAAHGLEEAAEKFGGPERLYKIVQVVLEKNGGKFQVDSRGLYTAVIRIGGFGIEVTGRVVGGTPRIGTFYIPNGH
jgi:RHS repeat-associated protein